MFAGITQTVSRAPLVSHLLDIIPSNRHRLFTTLSSPRIHGLVTFRLAPLSPTAHRVMRIGLVVVCCMLTQ